MALAPNTEIFKIIGTGILIAGAIEIGLMLFWQSKGVSKRDRQTRAGLIHLIAMGALMAYIVLRIIR